MTEEHPTAEDYRNRAERAEQFAGELQAKIDALFDEAMTRGEQAVANWTAWLIDGGKA
jgi:hypothetical protein